MELKKELGFLDVFSIASGAMISSGIFILPGVAFAMAGPLMIFGYMIGGIIALIGILSVIELTTAMPKAGGDYFFIMRSLGPLIGTISGILSWFSICLKTAFAIFGIASVIGSLVYGNGFEHSHILMISFFITSFFLILNIIGVEVTSTFEVIIVMFLLALMGTFILVGLFNVEVSHFNPIIQIYNKIDGKFALVASHGAFSSFTAGLLVSTASFIFVSFGGLLTVASVSEEVKNPRVNIPRGMIYSILTIIGVYGATLFVTVGVLPGKDLANSVTPIADAGRLIFGEWGFLLITVASLLAFISTANAGIMAASRYPLALSRDSLLPPIVGAVNKRFKTPTFAIIATGVLMMLSLTLPLETLAKTASAVILTTYILTNLSVIIIRESNLQNYLPSFKAPFYPWIQITTILLFGFFIYQLGPAILETSIALIVGSLSIYFLYGKKHSQKEYALLHLLLRITNSLKVGHSLEGELRDIVHQRDDIELNEFDKLIKEASIIDIPKKINLNQLIDLEVENLAQPLNLDKETLKQLLLERENEVTTAITGFTAIPHVVDERINKFSLVIFRCKKGVFFSENHPDIKATFLFVSPPNLNKVHLQTLASIASLVSDDDFQRKWMEGKSVNHLRDIILLRKRRKKNK